MVGHVTGATIPMTQVQCHTCHACVASYDVIHFVSMETGYLFGPGI